MQRSFSNIQTRLILSSSDDWVIVVLSYAWVPHLVVVSVAEGTAERIQDFTNSDIGAETAGAQLGVQRDGGARIRLISTSADGRASRWHGVLPDAEHVVDE